MSLKSSPTINLTPFFRPIFFNRDAQQRLLMQAIFDRDHTHTHTHLSETLVGGYKPLVKPAVHPSLPNLHTPAISPSDERAEGARGRVLSICETREAAMMKRRLASSTFEFKATQVPPNAAEQAPSCSPTRHSSLSLTPCSSLPLSLNLKTLLHCDLLLR